MIREVFELLFARVVPKFFSPNSFGEVTENQSFLKEISEFLFLESLLIPWDFLFLSIV